MKITKNHTNSRSNEFYAMAFNSQGELIFDIDNGEPFDSNDDKWANSFRISNIRFPNEFQLLSKSQQDSISHIIDALDLYFIGIDDYTPFKGKKTYSEWMKKNGFLGKQRERTIKLNNIFKND